MTGRTGTHTPPAYGPGADPRAVLLAFLPSEGLGGGIERYCDWLLCSIEETGVHVTRVALLHRERTLSLSRKVGFLFRSIAAARKLRAEGTVSVLVGHPSLAVAVLAAIRLARVRPAHTHVLFYGEDIWAFGRMSARIVGRLGGRPLTISTYSAGAVSLLGPAPILPPGIQRAWFEVLSSVDRRSETGVPAEIHVLTVFRLDAAVSKGLLEILEALEQVRGSHSCRLTVAGSGTLSPGLDETIARLPWVSVVRNPADGALAQLYADADVFVLATRTRSIPPTSGEGFGIVLVEAQLAGTPVVAPASGGSDSAFLAGITGLKPANESADALADVLRLLAADRQLRRLLGDNAKIWACSEFEPDRRTRAALHVLVGLGDRETTERMKLSLSPVQGDASSSSVVEA